MNLVSELEAKPLGVRGWPVVSVLDAVSGADTAVMRVSYGLVGFVLNRSLIA